MAHGRRPDGDRRSAPTTASSRSRARPPRSAPRSARSSRATSCNGTVEQAPVERPLGARRGSPALVQAVSGLTHVRPPASSRPTSARRTRSCRARRARATTAQQAATTLPKFNGKTLADATSCGYTPTQLRGAYGVDAGGHGRDRRDRRDHRRLRRADARGRREHATRALHGDRRSRPASSATAACPRTPPPSDDCGGNGWYGEQALDVEAVHGMAPAANVLYYGAASCNDDDLLAQLGQVVADNKASIVTNSWGEPTFVVDRRRALQHDRRDARQGLRERLQAGRRAGHRVLLLVRRRRRRPRRPAGVQAPGLPDRRPLGDLGRRHVDRHRQGQHAHLRDRLGHDALRARGRTARRWAKPGAFHGGAGGGFSADLRAARGTRTASSRRTPAAAPFRTSAMDADPTTGMLVGETQTFPLASASARRACTTASTASAARASASPLMAGVQAVAAGRPRGSASPTRASTSWRRVAQRVGEDDSPFYDVTPQGDIANVARRLRQRRSTPTTASSTRCGRSTRTRR